MEFEENFKVLNYEVRKRKEGEDNFVILNALDINNNPCKFFVFNKDAVNKFLNTQFAGLQDVLITFKLAFSNNIWNVTLLDIQ